MQSFSEFKEVMLFVNFSFKGFGGSVSSKAFKYESQVQLLWYRFKMELFSCKSYYANVNNKQREHLRPADLSNCTHEKVRKGENDY